MRTEKRQYFLQTLKNLLSVLFLTRSC